MSYRTMFTSDAVFNELLSIGTSIPPPHPTPQNTLGIAGLDHISRVLLQKT